MNKTNQEHKKIEINKINLEAKDNLSKLILESENNFTNQIANICKYVCENNFKILLLAGPSSAGKTTTSNLLGLHFSMLGKRVVTVSLDNFFLDREHTPRLPDGSYDFESINALDLPQFNHFIAELLTKKYAQMPIFNFITGRAEEKKEEIYVDENTIIIFEGLHALNPKLITTDNNQILRLYITLDYDFTINNEIVLPSQTVRLFRRMTRDHFTRGYTPKTTLKMWDNVLKGERENIDPFKDNADFRINSAHIYEPLLYANYTKKLLIEEVKNCDENEKIEIEKLIEILEHFNKIDKTYVPTTSLLWEFINSCE